MASHRLCFAQVLREGGRRRHNHRISIVTPSFLGFMSRVLGNYFIVCSNKFHTSFGTPMLCGMPEVLFATHFASLLRTIPAAIYADIQSRTAGCFDAELMAVLQWLQVQLHPSAGSVLSLTLLDAVTCPGFLQDVRARIEFHLENFQRLATFRASVLPSSTLMQLPPPVFQVSAVQIPVVQVPVIQVPVIQDVSAPGLRAFASAVCSAPVPRVSRPVPVRSAYAPYPVASTLSDSSYVSVRPVTKPTSKSASTPTSNPTLLSSAVSSSGPKRRPPVQRRLRAGTTALLSVMELQRQRLIADSAPLSLPAEFRPSAVPGSYDRLAPMTSASEYVASDGVVTDGGVFPDSVLPDCVLPDYLELLTDRPVWPRSFEDDPFELRQLSSLFYDY